MIHFQSKPFKILTAYFLCLGCWNAYNLDGGGSSIMIRRTEIVPGQPLWIPVNRQSMLAQRPLPMLLGVRLARQPE